MELGGVDIVLPDGGWEGLTIGGFGGHDGGVAGLGIETVDEVDVGTFIDAAEEWAVGLFDVELIPTDLRDFEAGIVFEPDDATAEKTETGSAAIELVAGFEEGLVADADAKEGRASFDELEGGVQQFLFAESVDAIVEGADAREHQGAGSRNLLGASDDSNIRADEFQRLMDAAEVSRAVIDESDHG